MFAIGLDIGTTSICGVLMDSKTGDVVKTINRKNDSWLIGEQWERVQNPQAIMKSINEILEELYCEDLDAIGVTGQMHGILYLDDEGKPISPLYTWEDQRGNLPFGKKTYAEHMSSHTGYGNVTHFYNKYNSIIPQNTVVFCTIHDYVAMTLAGKNRPLVHVSDAASFGNYDIETMSFNWQDELQPEITDETAILGEWRGIPVSVAIGDNQASFIGGGGTSRTVLFNVGTGSQISMATKKSVAPSGLEIRPLSKKTSIMVGSSLCGGRAFAILEKFFESVCEMAGADKKKLYDEMTAELSKKTDSEIVFKTQFYGTRENPNKKASITGLTEETFTPANLIYACLSGICDELYDMYKKTGERCMKLVGTGNGIRLNPTLIKIIEEKFKLKMNIPKYSEEAAIGSALFALTACGKYKSIEEAERIVNYEDIRSSDIL